MLVLLFPNEFMSMLGLDENRRSEADLVAICQQVREERRMSNNSNGNWPNVVDDGPPTKRIPKWNW